MKKLNFFILFLLTSLTNPISAFADDTSPFGTVNPPAGVSTYGTGVSGLENVLGVIFRALVLIAGLYALLNVIIAGYQFMMAGGDPENIQKAWNKIWQTLLGLIIAAGSFLIAAVISQLVFGRPDVILNPANFIGK